MCRWVHVCEQTRRGPRSTLRAIPQEPPTTLLFKTGSLSPWSSPSKLHWPTTESWGPACLHPHSASTTNAHHVRLFDVGSGVQTSVLTLASQTPYSLSYLPNPVPISLKGGYLHIDMSPSPTYMTLGSLHQLTFQSPISVRNHKAWRETHLWVFISSFLVVTCP